MILRIRVFESFIKNKQMVATPADEHLPGWEVRPVFYGANADEAIGKLIRSPWMDQFFAKYGSAKIEIKEGFDDRAE